MRDSLFEKEDESGMRCECCEKRKLSVSYRPNGYANDVHNDPTAMHTVCDECNYQSNQDI